MSQRVEKVLRELGYRLTPQRLMIIAAIQTIEGHVSAEDIGAQVRKQYPNLNPSTVYRTLELLKELGLVTETDLGEGRALYHWAEKGRRHLHLVCEKCGATSDVEMSALEPLADTLRQRYGFRANFSHFAISGRCHACQG
ncbi:MAG: transcriptional repressor [Chloroflexi bacterium]|nr:transcriptional repressor [Chloroflexota bacterium]